MASPTPERVQDQLQRLLASEQFAKSETSRKLLTYLLVCSLRDETPKEMAIAFDVFGKDPSFSGAEHSIVRVSVRTLRQKLTEYYAGPGRDDAVRFDVPKGGYRLTVTERACAPAPAPDPSATNSPGATRAGATRSPRTSRLALVLAAALFASALLNAYFMMRPAATDEAPELAAVRGNPFWSDLVKSDRRLTIVLGDLFMYTQLDDKTGRTLTVRDPAINSSEELRSHLASDPPSPTERGQRYVTMLQKAVVIGMASILPILDRPGRRIEVVARDDVTVDTIRENDIIYLGPLVRLGPLAGYYELRSQYRYTNEGSTITDVASGRTYLPEGSLGGKHVDYALAAKFPGPTGNHIMIVTSGARNAGILQIVRSLTSPDTLATLAQKLRVTSTDASSSLEALLTVTGFKQTDLAAEIIEVHSLPRQAAPSQVHNTKPQPPGT